MRTPPRDRIRRSAPLCIVAAGMLTGCADGHSESGDRAVGKAAPPVPAHVDDTEIVDVPDTGISLGWGWNSYDGRSVPAICVEFVEGSEPAQTQTVSIEEVSDNYEVMVRVSGSVEGSVSAVGTEASGSQSFAVDVDINNAASNFLLSASVQNGVRYAAPVPRAGAALPVGVEAITPRGGNGGEIRLTDAALKLARQRDITAFQQACGDSFVSAVFSGAKLTALISIATSSRELKSTLSTSVSGSGWGASMSASVNAAGSASEASSNSSVSVLLTGGRNEAIPTNVEEVIEMSRRLSIAAYEAPKDFHMAITPYEALAGWPGKELLGAETEYDQLTARWGFYTSLYDEIQHVLDAPERYRFADAAESSNTVESPTAAESSDTAPDEAVPLVAAASESVRSSDAAEGPPEPTPGRLEHLRALQDEVLRIVAALTVEARGCAEAGEDQNDGTPCTFDHERYPDPYRYRVQLPPPLFFGFENGQRKLDDNWNEIDLETDTLQQQVADKAKRRCQMDPQNLGCLSNAEIAELADLIGEPVLPLQEGGARHAWLLAPE